MIWNLFSALSLASIVFAHPGEQHDALHLKREIEVRNIVAYHAKRSLEACSGSLQHRSLMERSVQRRAEAARKLRERRGIISKSQKFRRDLATLQAFELVNHNMSSIDDYDLYTPPSTIFSANTSSILAPEVTDGPYYVVGETIRQNVKEDLYSDGVDLHLDIQYIDITTCEPVPKVYVDIWNANATGVYSGISTDGNYASGGYNSTYLRGIQVTDDDGVVEFDTIFPGHYAGRATHTHLLAHMDPIIYANDTIANGTVTHIGQLFFGEDLRSAVEQTYPYNTNTQALVSNDDDMWSIVQAADEYDPFPQYVYLGDDVSEGLLAWIQIGVNSSVDYTDDDYYSIAAYLKEDGGHVNEDTKFSGPPDGTNSSSVLNGLERYLHLCH